MFSPSAVSNVIPSSWPLKVFQFNLTQLQSLPWVIHLKYFAFSPQCSQSPGLHSLIICWFHYSNSHLLDFSLIVMANKVKTEYCFLSALGMWPQNAPPHLWEATKLLTLIFQASPLPRVVYFDSISLCRGQRIHALEWTPNANLSPFSSPVLAKRGSCL